MHIEQLQQVSPSLAKYYAANRSLSNPKIPGQSFLGSTVTIATANLVDADGSQLTLRNPFTESIATTIHRIQNIFRTTPGAEM